MNRILLIVLLLSTPLVYGSDLSWFGTEVSKRIDTGYSKTSDDFSGMLLVTPDTDWEKKWTTPTGSIPRISQADSVKYGEQLAILTFFMNPKPDERNQVDVQCSLMVKRPNRTIAVYEQGIACAEGEMQGGPMSIRLSPVVLKFVAEKDDPAGIWVIDVVVRDMNRKSKLELRTRFNLVAGDG